MSWELTKTKIEEKQKKKRKKKKDLEIALAATENALTIANTASQASSSKNYEQATNISSYYVHRFLVKYIESTIYTLQDNNSRQQESTKKFRARQFNE